MLKTALVNFRNRDTNSMLRKLLSFSKTGADGPTSVKEEHENANLPRSAPSRRTPSDPAEVYLVCFVPCPPSQITIRRTFRTRNRPIIASRSCRKRNSTAVCTARQNSNLVELRQPLARKRMYSLGRAVGRSPECREYHMDWLVRR